MFSKFANLVAAMEPQGKLLQAEPLTGGVSAQTTALTVQDGKGRISKLVARCHGQRDLERNPHIARDEFRLLSYLHAAGLPVPRPHFVDQEGIYISRPCLVCSYIPGRTITALDSLALRQMADTLARIHRLPIDEITFLSRQEEYIAAWLSRPAGAMGLEAKGRSALQGAWPWAQRNQPVLLHGDYWPGNILWQDGRLVGIIDWEDAALGDPLADLASTRLELLWACGSEAMSLFTTLYLQANPIDTANLAYYELLTALEVAPKIGNWGLDEPTHRDMETKLLSFARAAMQMIAK